MFGRIGVVNGPRLSTRGAVAQRRTRGIGVIPGIPIALIVLVVLTATVGPLLTTQSPTFGSLLDSLTPPAWMDGGSADHLLGTDRLGRDVLVRIIYGSRVSLIISFLVIGICATAGTVVGLVSGHAGGTVDVALMRAVDIVLSLPLILVAIVAAVLFEPSLTNLVVVMACLLWAPYARMVRGETLALRQREFVTAARAVGGSEARVLFRHIFPNLANIVIVLATLQLGYVILVEASLSFLGVGVPPPQPTWGGMIAEGRDFVTSAWWISFFPGMAVGLLILSTNLLGDWLRDRMDPQGRSPLML